MLLIVPTLQRGNVVFGRSCALVCTDEATLERHTMRSHAGAWERSNPTDGGKLLTISVTIRREMSAISAPILEKRGKTAGFLPGTVNAYTLPTGLPLHLIERSFK